MPESSRAVSTTHVPARPGQPCASSRGPWSRRSEYGRRRAARRVAAGRFAVHPGWRGRVPAGQVIVVDQVCARELIDRAVDAELWRADRRRIATAVLRTLIEAMDWRSGLITGTTRATAAERSGASLRTVSRVIAWATRVGVLVCVERGATAQFLGTRVNRAPAYVVTTVVGMPLPRPRRVADSEAVERIGNPPASCVSTQPLAPEGRSNASRQTQPWPHRDQTRTGAERRAATATVLDRIGLSGRVPLWKATAVLASWWRAGWCVSAVLYALDHHPDAPDQSRGDAVRGARDPLALIGHRLTPWRSRAAALPPSLVSVVPEERRRRAAALATRLDDEAPSRGPVASASGRAQAQELFSLLQENRRRGAVA